MSIAYTITALLELSGLIPVVTNPNQILPEKFPGLMRSLLFEFYTNRELYKVECHTFLII